MESDSAKGLDSYFIPEEHINVVLLAKQIFGLPDGSVEIQNICKTLHPINRRIINTYDFLRKGLFQDSQCLANTDVGRFYTVTGMLSVDWNEGNISETIYFPEYKLIDLNDDWCEIVKLTIESIEQKELFSHFNALEFKETKKYSKDEAFWWVERLKRDENRTEQQPKSL